MRRVASLYLPQWPIERIVRRLARNGTPLTLPKPEAKVTGAPRNDGWRPGARWAKPMRPDDGGSASSLPALARSDAPVLVTSHKIGSRVEIAAASPAVLALGIVPGMALTQARAAVPQLIVHPADPEGDAADLAALATMLARRWMPSVTIAAADRLTLDLTGVAHLHGGEERLAGQLVRLLARFGYTARTAVADTAGAATALALHAAGPVIILAPGEHREAIADLPARALLLDDRVAHLLDRLGVTTIGALSALPRGPLVRRFGKETAIRLDRALGDAGETLEPVTPPERISVIQRFADPIATAEAIAHWAGALVPRLTAALAEAGQGARALVLVAERVDRVAQPIRIGLARPSRDPAHLLKLIVRRIETIEPGYGIDALTLHVLRADPLGAQPFDEDLERRVPDLAPLIDTLANRIGAHRLWRAAPVESDVPERSVATRPPLDPPERDVTRLKLDDVRRLDRRSADHPWQPRWPRPARLLKRPELLDHVLAELPDRPPVRFTWRGRSHRVVCADGPERIAGEWWKRAAERDAVRDYFQVEDEEGRRYWLFRRGDGERAETGDRNWFMHGAFG